MIDEVLPAIAQIFQMPSNPGEIGLI